MSLQLWLAYVAAVFVISGTPGPNMLLALTHGIHHGLRGSVSTMLGLLSGLALILSISLAGLGAVLLASSVVFEVLKYLGAAYLIYLGVRTWRRPQQDLETGQRRDVRQAGQRFRIGVFVSLSNPKAILFFGSLYAVGVPAGTSPATLAVVMYGLFEATLQLIRILGR